MKKKALPTRKKVNPEVQALAVAKRKVKGAIALHNQERSDFFQRCSRSKSITVASSNLWK